MLRAGTAKTISSPLALSHAVPALTSEGAIRKQLPSRNVETLGEMLF